MTWQKGQSGNPGGRVGVPAEVREPARKHTAQAVERLVHWMNSDNASASVAAANALLDRGYGKPAQVVFEKQERGAPGDFDDKSTDELIEETKQKLAEVTKLRAIK
jgi:hypothetical protein